MQENLTLAASDIIVESASATVPEFWVFDSDPNDEGWLYPGDDFRDDIF